MHYLDYDEDLLLLCEDMQQALKKFCAAHPASLTDGSPLKNRLDAISADIVTEARMIEELSLPGRFIVEHLSMMLGRGDYAVGFAYRAIKSGRRALSDIKVGEWGTITVVLGDVSVSWRDADAQYMFYPDQIVIRTKDLSEDEISFFFAYSFKYAPGLLKRFRNVKDDPKTIYWHDSLLAAVDLEGDDNSKVDTNK
jgi:hypothetical protein